MTESQDKPSSDFAEKFALLNNQLESMMKVAGNLVEIKQGISQVLEDIRGGTKIVEEQVVPLMKRIAVEQEKLRSLIFTRTDSIEGTIALVREDIRNSWSTADYAISNSRHVREESEKLLNMISTMQRQQQILTAQVDELRKSALEKGRDTPHE